ncbi:P-loop containing nucleoside triphosphate hydrolase protein [Mycena floridula]|nr:P-loop containing nucleoside triphosphate hydrolase protein [Mycena floridula]
MSKTELNQTLQSLNPPQLQAVQHDPGVPLQILAGPGSGKTKVLTSRIAHLILNHQISPSSICAVTFTNKAATEMRERLTKLIGKERTSEVRMGTFHALCALYLRKYPQLVGIAPNFTVCDTEESRKIVSPLLKKYKDYLESRNLVLKEGTVLATISRAKAQGFSASAFLEDISAKFLKDSKEGRIHTDNPTHDINQIVAEIYTVYETNLRRNNSLDFDDLLLFGVKLFKYNKIAVRWCKYVLVDEFQDTNITQYELMKALAISSRVTIVGDPDQSIYGWRAAEVGNLGKMKKDFPATEQILLEQNYRSTASILAASLAIISQDKTRIPKKLHTSHPAGPTPVLMCLDGEYGEAAFIADEIKRLVAQTGGMLGWGDFVILLRFNALSRAIESALQKEKIPNRILGGHKFFERCEIKDLLAYLQIIDNPQFAPSFARAVNVPSRGIGEKTLIDIAARAEKVQVSHLALVEKICDGRAPDTKPASKRKLTDFVRIMGTLRKLANEGASPSNLIRKLLDLIGYLDHLKKTEPDWDTRWENVQELITFASDVEGEIKANMHPEGEGNTPLRLFLQASMLSSEGDNQAEGDNKD